MADIFISYSSYDREKAMALVNVLHTAGYEVWLDQGGIGGAQDWSSEIVDALNKSKTVLFLISKDSVTSYNCAKEIHLASEKHKNILPVILEETPLPVLFEYPLAGLQRVPYERTDAILQALEILESGKTVLEAMFSQSKIDDGIIRLAVLPFEDQSPSQDNEWFASGMMDELITTLGSLERMKVNPRGEVTHYKKNRPKLQEIVNELNCRYVVEGVVQKAGERIRIKVSLIDAKENKQLWHEKYDGTFDDIFDLQDKTCFAITEALKLSLTPEDEQKIEKKPTENAEAYELYLRGIAYGNRVTQNDSLIALSLFAQASKSDPEFLGPLVSTANLLISRYEDYTRDPLLLDEAEAVMQKALVINPEDSDVYRMRSKVYAAQGKIEEAIAAAEQAVALKPYIYSFMTLGVLYGMYAKRHKDAIEAFEKALIEAPGDLHLHYMIPMQHRIIGDGEGMQQALERAIPFYQQYIRTHPEDQNKHMNLAVLLYIAGRHNEGLLELESVLRLPNIDGATYFNASALYLDARNHERALDLLEKAIENGWSKIEQIDHYI